LPPPRDTRGHVVEPNEIDIFAFAVLGNFQQIDETQEAGFTREFGGDIGETDRLDGIHLDLTFLHSVAGAHFDMRPRPDANAAGDFSAANSVAKPLGKHHEQKFTLGGGNPRNMRY
jgi:hypothetical protein